MKKRLKVVINLIFAIFASAIINFILQFLVYPNIEKVFGEERYGEILFFVTLGIVSGLSVGGAACTTYLKSRQKYKAVSGDFFVSIMIISIIPVMVSIFLSKKYIQSEIELAFVVLFVFLSIIKEYSCVDFLLNNDYKRYFLYCVLISSGFVFSLPLIKISKHWEFLILGPIFGLVYILFRRVLFLNTFKRDNYFKDVFNNTIVLSGANLINYATQNLDRLILLPLTDGVNVSYYYVASLLSKTLSMVTGPVNNLIVSYFTRTKRKNDLKMYIMVNVLVIIAGVLFYMLCVLTSKSILGLPFLYPDMIDKITNIIPWASLSQVIVICSSVIVAMDLVVAPEKAQFVIQTLYAAFFLVLAVVLTRLFGLNGFIVASCASGIIRYVAAFVIGFVYCKKRGKDES